MGSIKKILATTKLPERDDHNTRCFVDLAENIHFHYREHRMVFSVPEFLEFAKAIGEGANNLVDEVNKGYKEETDFKTKIIGGNQIKFLELPNPKKSAYFNNRFQIELQNEGYVDRIHIHYRDYRLVMNNKETFLKFCATVEAARKNLD